MIYTFESSSSEEIAGSIYITLNAVNNKTREPEHLIIKYYDYCFIDTITAFKINKKYNKKITTGYKFYHNNKECCKVYFNCSSEMKKILSEYNCDSSFIYTRPDKKFMIEKKILYKFIVNTNDTPIPHEKIFGIETNEIDEVRVISADIEVDSEGDLKFPTGDNAVHPVISIGYSTWTGDLIWTCLDKNIKNDVEKLIWKLKDQNKELNDLPVEVIFFKYEKDLILYLGEMQKIYQSYIVTGWNFLRFDMYYLIGRCKVLGINPSFLTINNFLRYKKHYDTEGRDVVKVWTRECYFIDSLEAFIRGHEEKLSHNDLDFVASEILGSTYGKVKSEMTISEMYKKDKKSLMYYNIMDAILVNLIMKKTNLYKFYEFRRKMKGITFSDVFKTITPVTSAMMYFAEKSKVALPDRRYAEKSQRLKGAYVYTDKLQIIEFAGMFDFKAEYASIAASMNCSGTTLVKEEKLQNQLTKTYNSYKKSGYKKKPKILEEYTVSPGIGTLIFFENKKDSFERKFLMDRFMLREKYFNEKHKYKIDSEMYTFYHLCEQDVKLDGNGLYGAWSNKYFILFQLECAQAITGVGRNLLDHQRKFLKSIGHNTGLSDTDSADINIPASTKEEAVEKGFKTEKILSIEINKYVHTKFLFGTKNGYLEGFNPDEENINTQWIFAKFEKLFNPMIITGKMKHYAYRLVWQDGKFLEEPKYKVKGFECIQRNVSPILKEAQFNLIKNILDRKITNKTQTINFLKPYKQKIYKMKNLDTLSMTAGYKNEITEYENVKKGYLPPIHAQAMCNSMANFKLSFEPLSRFKLIKVKRKKSGKYKKDIIMINGINVKFQDIYVGYYDQKELPKDFFEYFKPDYYFYYHDLVIDKNEVFLKLMNVDKIVFTNQTQLTKYTKTNNE